MARSKTGFATLFVKLSLAVAFGISARAVLEREAGVAVAKQPALGGLSDLTRATIDATVSVGLPQTIGLLVDVVKGVDREDTKRVYRILREHADSENLRPPTRD